MITENSELTPEQADLINRNEITSTLLNEEEEIYKENIIDHYKYPHNKKELENYDFKHRELNPLCGDEITIFIKLWSDKGSKNARIAEVSFQGNGCAISQASVSLLTDYIKKMSLDQVKSLKNDDVFSLLRIPISHVRLKCATLALITIQKALEGKK